MGTEKYGARFFDADRATGPAEALGDDRRSDVLGADEPERNAAREPRAGLRRVGGAIALAAVAVGAFWSTRPDDPAPPTPQPEVTRERPGAAVTILRNVPPPTAPLTVTAATAELWDNRGYSYSLELTNRTPTGYELVDIDFAPQGVEMLWDTSLVVTAGTTTTLHIDFLVVSCAAAANRPTPTELRLTLRTAGSIPGVAGSVSVLDVDLVGPSGDVAAAGGVRCDGPARAVLSLP